MLCNKSQSGGPGSCSLSVFASAVSPACCVSRLTGVQQWCALCLQTKPPSRLVTISDKGEMGIGEPHKPCHVQAVTQIRIHCLSTHVFAQHTTSCLPNTPSAGYVQTRQTVAAGHTCRLSLELRLSIPYMCVCPTHHNVLTAADNTSCEIPLVAAGQEGSEKKVCAVFTNRRVAQARVHDTHMTTLQQQQQS